jgi:hypothetical protein
LAQWLSVTRSELRRSAPALGYRLSLALSALEGESGGGQIALIKEKEGKI